MKTMLRALNRLMLGILFLSFPFAVFSAPKCYAATLTVTSALDPHEADKLTLREAIDLAMAEVYAVSIVAWGSTLR